MIITSTAAGIRRERSARFILFWTAAIFLTFVAVWFIHESAHGLGYRLEGQSVSTGFNLVGRSGKQPNEAGFELDLPVEGLTAGLVLGPLATWIIAILFTVLLLRRSLGNRFTLLVGAIAISSGFMRLMPLVIFFISAVFGNTRGVWQDEQRMALGNVGGVELPISEGELGELIESQESLFLADPGFYFWPMISTIISLACIILAYRRLHRIYYRQLKPRVSRLLFTLMPLILFFPIFAVVTILDQIIRISW